jgi:hypothetical protein
MITIRSIREGREMTEMTFWQTFVQVGIIIGIWEICKFAIEIIKPKHDDTSPRR